MNTPKYIAVKLDITHRIKTGEFRDSLRLPSENEIAAFYAVSRVTARKVFDELEKEGRIIRKQGKGTYLLPALIQISPERRLAGLRTGIEKQGFHATVRLIAKKMMEPEEEIVKDMKLDPEEKALLYSRTYLANGIPVMYAVSIINRRLLPGVENYDFNFISYSEVLENFYATNYHQAERTIQAQQAGDIAPLLETAPEIPVVMVSYLLYGEKHGTNSPVEQVKLYVRTDVPGFTFDIQ